MGGIMAQTLVFTAFGAALSIANDRKNQAVDRFRSLPIAKGAVLGGHAVANVIKSLLPIALMSVTGYLIGWRIRGSFTDTFAAYALMLAFAFAMIWMGVLLGSLASTPEGVNGIAFAVLFPLTFVASTFVPLASMPEPLRTFAAWNPVTTLADALRDPLRQSQHPDPTGRPVVGRAPDRLHVDLDHRHHRDHRSRRRPRLPALHRGLTARAERPVDDSAGRVVRRPLAAWIAVAPGSGSGR